MGNGTNHDARSNYDIYHSYHQDQCISGWRLLSTAKLIIMILIVIIIIIHHHHHHHQKSSSSSSSSIITLLNIGYSVSDILPTRCFKITRHYSIEVISVWLRFLTDRNTCSTDGLQLRLCNVDLSGRSNRWK